MNNEDSYENRVTPRGFRLYGRADVPGVYGEVVKLYESSSAMEPQCWLFIDTAENKNDLGGGKRVEATALLDMSRAVMLRDMLNEFISENS